MTMMHVADLTYHSIALPIPVVANNNHRDGLANLCLCEVTTPQHTIYVAMLLAAQRYWYRCLAQPVLPITLFGVVHHKWDEAPAYGQSLEMIVQMRCELIYDTCFRTMPEDPVILPRIIVRWEEMVALGLHLEPLTDGRTLHVIRSITPCP